MRRKNIKVTCENARKRPNVDMFARFARFSVRGKQLWGSVRSPTPKKSCWPLTTANQLSGEREIHSCINYCTLVSSLPFLLLLFLLFLLHRVVETHVEHKRCSGAKVAEHKIVGQRFQEGVCCGPVHRCR